MSSIDPVSFVADGSQGLSASHSSGDDDGDDIHN